MKTLILAAIRCSLLLLVPTVTYAISAQWDLDPVSGDWNTAANWTPMAVPNGPADIATFGLSNTTNVSISEDTEVNGITFSAAATNPYTITATPGLTLTISGVGIVNISGTTQNFATAVDPSGNFGQIVFTNSSTAGSNVSISNAGGINFFNRSTAGSAGISNGGTINFFNTSTAGSADISNGSFDLGTPVGTINFFNRSTAGSAGISNGGTINFFNTSTAGSAFISNTFESPTAEMNFFNRSSAGNAGIELDFASLQFANNSTAGNSTMHLFATQASFLDNSTAGSASIAVVDDNVRSFLTFTGTSTAGSASISAHGSIISFDGSSRGGTAQIELRGGGSPPLIFSPSVLGISHGVTIGSLAGDEFSEVDLGANNLTVGSNNLSTTFAGIIQDGGQNGSLTKIGTGTLTLTRANTYIGNTNINRGVLQVDGSITSNTFVNHAGSLAGTGTINGNVTNIGRVSPGSAGAPGMLTIVHNYTQAEFATLMIQIAGMSPDQFSVLNVMGNANLNGFLDPVLLNGFVPSVGDSFVFLNYASLTGEFSRILHPVFNNGTEQWSVIYQNNNAILTVGPNTIPDGGSTLLLLMLGLLGLLTHWRYLLRGCS